MKTNVKVNKSFYTEAVPVSSHSKEHLASRKSNHPFLKDTLHEKSNKNGFFHWVRTLLKSFFSLICCCFKADPLSSPSKKKDSSYVPQKKRSLGMDSPFQKPRQSSITQKTKSKLTYINVPIPNTRPSQSSLQEPLISDKNSITEIPHIINPGRDNCAFNVIMQGIVAIPSWQRAVTQSCKEQTLRINDFLHIYKTSLPHAILQASEYFDYMRRALHLEVNQQIEVMDIFNRLFEGTVLLPHAICHKLDRTTRQVIPEEPTKELVFALMQKQPVEHLETLLYQLFNSDRHTYKQMAEAPPELLLERHSAPGNMAKIDNPNFQMSLPNYLTLSNKAANYKCDFFVQYENLGQGGHYQCFRLIEDTWWQINDTNITPVRSGVALYYFQGAYIYHFNRIDP